MPNLSDIIEVAEALESKAVFEVPERCVAVRNRNAKCRRCLDACLANAITIGNNKLAVDNKICVACGACTAVCPTEALVPLRPTDNQLRDAAEESLREAGAAHAHKTSGAPVLPGSAGHGESMAAAVQAGLPVLIACARIASHRVADPHLFAEVPCLARVDVSVLLALAAAGAQEIQLIDGGCASCKYRATSPGVDQVVATANDCMEVMGAGRAVCRVQQFPQHAVLADKRSLLGESRRGFFTSARSWTAGAAGKTAQYVVDKNLGTSKAAKSIKETLGMGGKDTLPQFEPERRETTLNAMDALGAPQEGAAIDSPLFGNISIDEDACSACGMCAVFCPTGALKKSKLKPPAASDGTPDGGSYLEFTAGDCVQCGLCVDACMKKCMTLSTQVPVEDIFSFEPRLIHLPKPKTRPGILSSARR